MCLSSEESWYIMGWHSAIFSSSCVPHLNYTANFVSMVNPIIVWSSSFLPYSLCFKVTWASSSFSAHDTQDSLAVDLLASYFDQPVKAPTLCLVMINKVSMKQGVWHPECHVLDMDMFVMTMRYWCVAGSSSWTDL